MSTQILSGDFNVSFEEEIMFHTLITPFESGKEQRRKKWSLPRRRFLIQWRGRHQTRIEELWNFYTSMNGAFDTFYFENTNESPVSLSGDESFGTGNSSETVFTLNRKPVIPGTMDVTVGGVAKTEITDYTVNYTTGVVTFDSAPGSGDAVVAEDYRFYRICRFETDKNTRELFAYKLYNMGMELVEVV